MAVADDAMKPSPPPPPRIVVALLMFVRFVLAPMLALVRVAARWLTYPGFAVAWVLSAAWAASVVARRAWGEGSAPFVFLQVLAGAALKVFLCGTFLLLALAAVLLCGTCLAYVVALVSGSGPEFKKTTFGAISWKSTQEVKFPRAVVVGFVADLAFILLIVAGILVMMVSSPVEGSISQGKMIGSVIADVGMFGLHATACFVIIPALALDVWREDQSDKKAGLPVADC